MLICDRAVVGEINEDKDKTIDFSRVKADSLKQVRVGFLLCELL